MPDIAELARLWRKGLDEIEWTGSLSVRPDDARALLDELERLRGALEQIDEGYRNSRMCNADFGMIAARALNGDSDAG